MNRRTFLKKSAYIAPTIITLGTLTSPTQSEAMSFRGPHHKRNKKCNDDSSIRVKR